MTAKQFIDHLRAAGFTCSLDWQAKKTDERKVSVEQWFVYHPDHGLLTSCIINSFEDTGCAVYWCNERNTVTSNVEHLRGIVASRATA